MSIAPTNGIVDFGTFRGATAGVNGTQGLVPPPAAGEEAKFLRADSTWQTAGGGSVTSVTATSPLASSGGATPDISFTGVLPTANGGTGIAYFTAAGPTVARIYTFPDQAATILYSGGALGTPASGTLTNATGLPISSGVSGLGANVATALGVAVGSAGAFITFNGALGTPSSGVATNLTGTASGLTAGTVTTNANLTGIVTSVGNATAIADKAISYAKLADGTAGNLLTWSAAGVMAVVATGNSGQVLTSNGAGAAPTFQAAAGGGSTLNGITAATADQAGISNGDWNIVWNWQKTTDAEVAFTFGESAASTNGTSTSGVPNQIIAKFSTLAASTASPLSVYSRGAHVFSVSPTTAQILTASGSEAVPAIAGTAVTTTGMWFAASTIAFSVGAKKMLEIERAGDTSTFYSSGGTALFRLVHSSAQARFISNGSPSFISITDTTNFNSGFFWPATLTVGVAVNSIENSRFVAGGLQFSKGTADAVSYAMDFKKSRGTVASPTVITTGDVLMTQSAYAYLGATNTYRETGRLEITSKGTISDATTGVGSIVTIYGKTQGTDVTVQPTLVITDGSTATIKFAGTGMATANGTTATVLGSVGPAGASTTVQEWLTVTMPGGSVRYIPCF